MCIRRIPNIYGPFARIYCLYALVRQSERKKRPSRSNDDILFAAHGVRHRRIVDGSALKWLLITNGGSSNYSAD